MNNTKDMHKLHFSVNNMINYFVIISFLFPRGYAEFNSTYKTIFTCAIWISTIIIWAQFIISYRKIIVKQDRLKDILFIISYFASVIIITFIVRGFFINGYQKLITYPSICLFTICNLKRNSKSFLNTINNVFLVLLILQVLLHKIFFQNHITFLGHVQMISQLCSLAIFCALIFWMLFHEKKTITILIVLLSLFTMITTDAASAKITCIILCIIALLYKLKKHSFMEFDSKVYIICGMIFSIIIVSLSVINNLKFDNEVPFLDLSGRSFVWIDALSKIKNKITFGYGVEGVLLDVFWNKWNNSQGFNYAHNQMLQNLLDGGVVVSITFLLMIFSFCRNTKNISNTKYKVLINAILITFLTIMIVESATSYCYVFICFAIIYVLPDIVEKIEKGENINGTY